MVKRYLFIKVEKIVTDALANLDGEFAGKYYPLAKMTDAEQQQLIDVRAPARCFICISINCVGLHVII